MNLEDWNGCNGGKLAAVYWVMKGQFLCNAPIGGDKGVIKTGVYGRIIEFS